MQSIGGYEGLYSVTEDGKVWSHQRKRWMKPCLNKEGYPKVCLVKKRKRQTMTIRRLVAETFIPNLENKSQINCKNGIKTDNRAENLRWCTAKENMYYSNNFGENHYNAKLTWEQVREMRENHNNYRWREKPWKKYGIHRTHYYLIINNKSWKNDPRGYN